MSRFLSDADEFIEALDEATDKVAKAKRRTVQLPARTKATKQAERSLASSFTKAFKKVRSKVADAVAEELRAQGYEPQPEAEKIAKISIRDDTLDNILSLHLDDLAEPVAEAIGKVAETAGKKVLSEIGVDKRGSLVNQVNTAADRWARTRGAELVGMRVADDGSLVRNPNADWSISRTTRTLLRATIADGIENNMGIEEIADAIESDFAFSSTRAATIARTEVMTAHNQGALEGYQAAQSIGVRVQKEWLLGSESCELCEENADAGPIELDDTFPSGDIAPPGHPNCTCALSSVVDDSDIQEE